VRWLLQKTSSVKDIVHHLVARRKLGMIAPPMLHSYIRKLRPEKSAHLLETGSQGTAPYPIFAVELSDHKLAVGHDAQNSDLKPSARPKSSNQRFVLRLVTSLCTDKLSASFEEIPVGIEHPKCDRSGPGIAPSARVCEKHRGANVVGDHATVITNRWSAHTVSPPRVGRAQTFRREVKQKKAPR
jgi:hypothetical protein